LRTKAKTTAHIPATVKTPVATVPAFIAYEPDPL
jgi:hypothetical protein